MSLDMLMLGLSINGDKNKLVDFYKKEKPLLEIHKWPAPTYLTFCLCGLPEPILFQIHQLLMQEIKEEMVWVAVYPELKAKESYLALVPKETCVQACKDICASLSPSNPIDYMIDSDFSYMVDHDDDYDERRYLNFICNEEGALGGFKRNEYVSPMLRFKLDFDNRITGRPTHDTVYGPVVACLIDETTEIVSRNVENVVIIDDYDDEYDEEEVDISIAQDITNHDLGDILVEWCEGWYTYHGSKLYGGWEK